MQGLETCQPSETEGLSTIGLNRNKAVAVDFRAGTVDVVGLLPHANIAASLPISAAVSEERCFRAQVADEAQENAV
jgi:hypothetical protein